MHTKKTSYNKICNVVVYQLDHVFSPFFKLTRNSDRISMPVTSEKGRRFLHGRPILTPGGMHSECSRGSSRSSGTTALGTEKLRNCERKDTTNFYCQLLARWFPFPPSTRTGYLLELAAEAGWLAIAGLTIGE